MTTSSRAIVAALALVTLHASDAPSLGAQASALDTVSRTTPPPEGPPPALHLPPIQYRTLPNGLRIALVERHDVPAVTVLARFTATLPDPPGREGLRSAMRRLLNAGTASLTADQLADSSMAMGGTVSPTGFTTLVPLVDRAFALMSEQLLRATFPETELALWRKEQVGNLKHAEESPEYWADRLFAARVFGPKHEYSRRQSAASVTAITQKEVIALHDAVVRPRNTTLIIVGALTIDDAATRVERAFGRWTAAGAPTRVVPPQPAPTGPTSIYVYDRPGSAQSVVAVGRLGPRRDSPDYEALTLANTLLGGAFHSRLNLDLREAHGYTYGVRSELEDREPPEVGAFMAEAAIATPKTDSAATRLIADLRELTTTRPVTDSELAFAKASEVKGLPLQFETTSAEASGVRHILELHLPDDYYNTLTARTGAVTLAQVRAAAGKYVDASHLAVVVVGDRAAIEPGLRAAHIGPVILVNAQGTPISK